MKKDFNTGNEEAEYEIVLNHLYVGGWGKPVAHLCKLKHAYENVNKNNA